MIDQTVGLVAHLPLNAILKGSQGVEFELVAVELVEARKAAQWLHTLMTMDLSPSFQIAAPSPPSPSVDVEQPAGGDEGTANASPPPATLDELRLRVRDWSPADKRALRDELEDRDATDPEIVLDAILTVEGFHNIHTEPVTRDIPERPEPPAKRDIDEGHEVDTETVRDAGQAYARLPDDKRSWVSMAGAKIRLNPDHGGKPTERRATLLGALCELADQGMDDDDAVRAIAAHLIGDIAWQAGNTTGDVVAALDCAEAHRFAAIASLVCMSLAPFEFVEGQAARCVLTSELAVAA